MVGVRGQGEHLGGRRPTPSQSSESSGVGLWGLSAVPASGSSETMEAEPNSMLWIGDTWVLVRPGLPGWMARSITDTPALAAGWARTPRDGLCLLQLLWGEKAVDVTLGAFWLSVRASLGCCDSPFWLQPCRVQEQKVSAAGPAQASQASSNFVTIILASDLGNSYRQTIKFPGGILVFLLFLSQ